MSSFKTQFFGLRKQHVSSTFPSLVKSKTKTHKCLSVICGERSPEATNARPEAVLPAAYFWPSNPATDNTCALREMPELRPCLYSSLQRSREGLKHLPGQPRMQQHSVVSFTLPLLGCQSIPPDLHHLCREMAAFHPATPGRKLA